MRKRTEEMISGIIIASGGGSTGNVVMKKIRSGVIKKLKIVALVSTKSGAGCIKKAKSNGILPIVLGEDCSIKDKGARIKEWNLKLHKIVLENNIKLVILAGCVKEIFPISGVVIVNTHPAHKHLHGGRHMYGLAVHKHVLIEVRDQIRREIKKVDDVFETVINFHRVDADVDTGPSILKMYVRIPQKIIKALVEKRLRIGKAAERLQRYVLQYEYIMLPAAVNAVVRKILNEGGW